MEYFYIEVSVKESCGCSKMLEAFLVMADTKQDAINKVCTKYSTAKDFIISTIYRCSDIKDGVYLIYTRRT
jgi:hypothetical protein